MGTRKPQISLNKLAEYTTSTVSRRRKIVKDAKYPPKTQTTLYAQARRAIKAYFLNGQDKKIIQDAIDNIKAKATFSDYQKRDQTNSILALEQFFNMPQIDMSQYTVEDFEGFSGTSEVAGVNISVFPDLIIKKKVKDKSYIGGMKIHIIKGNQLNISNQEIVGVVLKDFIEKNIATEDEVTNNEICYSLDIFNNSNKSAPKTYKSRFKTVEDCCAEINMYWQQI